MQHLCIRRLKAAPGKWIYPVPYLSRKSYVQLSVPGRSVGSLPEQRLAIEPIMIKAEWTRDLNFGGLRNCHQILCKFSLLLLYVKLLSLGPVRVWLLLFVNSPPEITNKLPQTVLHPKYRLHSYCKSFTVRATTGTSAILNSTPHFLLKFFLYVIYLGYFITIVYKKL